MELQRFVRKPFEVSAVRVTNDNLPSVALWCGGEIRTNVKGESYIKVWVPRPANERQTMAFIGDHIVHAGTGFKVYSHRAFIGSFIDRPVEEACGSTEFTVDHKSCVLGAGHRKSQVATGCRSLQDYLEIDLYQDKKNKFQEANTPVSFDDVEIDYNVHKM